MCGAVPKETADFMPWTKLMLDRSDGFYDLPPVQLHLQDGGKKSWGELRQRIAYYYWNDSNKLRLARHRE